MKLRCPKQGPVRASIWLLMTLIMWTPWLCKLTLLSEINFQFSIATSSSDLFNRFSSYQQKTRTFPDLENIYIYIYTQFMNKQSRIQPTFKISTIHQISDFRKNDNSLYLIISEECPPKPTELRLAMVAL